MCLGIKIMSLFRLLCALHVHIYKFRNGRNTNYCMNRSAQFPLIFCCREYIFHFIFVVRTQLWPLFQRVMPSCLFCLLRFYLRVDNTLIRVIDTRIYHEVRKEEEMLKRPRKRLISTFYILRPDPTTWFANTRSARTRWRTSPCRRPFGRTRTRSSTIWRWGRKCWRSCSLAVSQVF